MSMLEQRIQQQFFEAADLLSQAAQGLSRPVADAVQALAVCVTSGGKVLVAGSDVGAGLAPVLAATLTGRFERDRPPLAALALRDDSLQSLAQQVRALGQPGDLLLVLDAGADGQRLREAAAAARALDLTVVALTGPEAGEWRGLLTDTDVLLTVPHDRPARVAEAQLVVLHALCDAVDLQLMGELDS
jgi:D-sedoheptulose 7-phosphate isomerase